MSEVQDPPTDTHGAQVPLEQLKLSEQHSRSPVQEPPIERHEPQMLLLQKPPQQSVSPEQAPPSDTHPPLHTPSTHSCPSAQRLKQLPQWRSFLCRFTHLPLQQVWVERQRLEQLPQWRSLVSRLTHLSPQRVCPSEHRSSAQATPGTAANTLPRRALPMIFSTRPREMLLVVKFRASSSKERSTFVGLSAGERPPLCSSAAICFLLLT